MSRLDRGLEAALRHDRVLILAALAAMVAIAWVYLWHLASAMDGAASGVSMPMATGMAMGMPQATPVAADAMQGSPGFALFLAPAFALTFAMWAAMMAAMMLPSAAPAILAYGGLVRSHGARGATLPSTWVFALGYLLVWAGFSAAASLLQMVLEQRALLTPSLATASTRLGAATLIAAGVWQLTPLKQACLTRCRSPLTFFVTRWRAGVGGALRMGLEHGVYCVGCCWALMLLLFVAGVMNLAWVAAIAVFVFVEKVAPAGRVVTRAAAVALLGYGSYLLAVS
ncbi:MAG: DUF2182 domain-containing protein [Candidatus Levyibacteriota bacterium]